MKILLFLFFTIFAYVGCGIDARRATESEKRDAMARINFDRAILNNLKTFIAHKDFLLENIDTLLNFRKGENACQKFLRPNSNYDVNSAPEFLQNQLENSWNKIGAESTFEICRNRVIAICPRIDEVGIERSKNQLRIHHELIWNYQQDRNRVGYDLYKDSVLADNLVYRIGLIEYYGQ